MAYNIGLVEDDKTDASEIMLSLLDNAREDLDESSFFLYDLKQEAGFKEELLNIIRDDILHDRIQCLIVDYKLDTMYEIVEGIEIVDYFHALLPEFPVVILTNVPHQGKENDLADPDKVYPKKVFLNPDSDDTKTMVYNIIRNIKRYSKTRASLELDRDTALEAILQNRQYSDAEYDKLITSERKLAKYSPIEVNAVDEAYSSEDMKEAIKDLKEIKNLLEQME